MADNKKSFVAYCDWLETFEALPDDKAGQLAKHLFRYVNDLNPKSDDVLINAVFANIKHTLKRDLVKYEKIREKRSEAGKASAKKRQQVLTSVESDEQNSTNSTVSVNDSVNVSVNESEIKNNNNKIESVSNIVNRLKEDEIFFSQAKNITEIGISNLKILLLKFESHLNFTKDNMKRESDFRNHFINWVKKQKDIEPETTGIDKKKYITTYRKGLDENKPIYYVRCWGVQKPYLMNLEDLEYLKKADPKAVKEERLYDGN